MTDERKDHDGRTETGLLRGAGRPEGCGRSSAEKSIPGSGQKVPSEAKFKEASEAYSILSDPEKRRQYDQFGHAAFDGPGGGGGGGFYGNAADFSDIFGDLFGDGGGIFGDFFTGGRRSTASANEPQKGANVRTSVRLTFEEAVFGCEKEITVNFKETCTVCHGTGAKAGTNPETGEYEYAYNYYNIYPDDRNVLELIFGEETEKRIDYVQGGFARSEQLMIFRCDYTKTGDEWTLSSYRQAKDENEVREWMKQVTECNDPFFTYPKDMSRRVVVYSLDNLREQAEYNENGLDPEDPEMLKKLPEFPGVWGTHY